MAGGGRRPGGAADVTVERMHAAGLLPGLQPWMTAWDGGLVMHNLDWQAAGLVCATV